MAARVFVRDFEPIGRGAQGLIAKAQGGSCVLRHAARWASAQDDVGGWAEKFYVMLSRALFRARVEARTGELYIFSGASIPSSPSDASSCRSTVADKASREAFTAGSAFNTGQAA